MALHITHLIFTMAYKALCCLALLYSSDQIANIHWVIKKAREFQKNNYFCFIDYAKAFDYVEHTHSGKFFKSREYQTTLTDS